MLKLQNVYLFGVFITISVLRCIKIIKHKLSVDVNSIDVRFVSWDSTMYTVDFIKI